MSYPAATAATNSKTDTPSSLSRIAARQGVFREIKEGETIASPSFISLVLLAEVALQQALERLAAAGLVPGRLSSPDQQAVLRPMEMQ